MAALDERHKLTRELLDSIGNERRAAYSGPNRRAYARIAYPAMTVFTAVGDCQVSDWSLGGLKIIGYRGKVVPNALVQVKFAFNLKKDKIFTAEGEIVRGSEARQELSLKFENLPRDAYKALVDALPHLKR